VKTGAGLAIEAPDGSGTRPPNSPWRFAATGLEVAASIALGVILGVWADGRFGSAPWGTLAGGFLGMAIGLYTLIRNVL
jgi:ATP synthase protein I